MQLVKNLFKLGLVALQYVIVYFNLDTRSSVLRDFVKNEEKSEAPRALDEMYDEYTIEMENDVPPYVGCGDNVRAYTHLKLDPNYDIHKKYGPIK